MSIGLSNVVVVVVPMVTGGIEIGAVAGKFWVIGLLSEQTEFVAASRLALPAWLSEASFPRYRLLFVFDVVGHCCYQIFDLEVIIGCDSWMWRIE